MSRIESAAGLKGAAVAAEVTSPSASPTEAAQAAEKVLALAPGQYISPVVTVDNSSGLAIIQYRDGQTGETEVQWPSSKAVQQYLARSAEEAQESGGEQTGAQSAGQQQAPKTEAESAPATQQAAGAPAEGSTAPQSGGASAHVSLIA